MRRFSFGLFASLAALSLPLWAAPQLQPGAIVNGASFAVRGAPHSAIAQGSLFSVFGVDVGPTPAVRAEDFPLPTRLGAVSIAITANGRQFEGIIVYASSTQVSAILPSDVPVGPATLVLSYNGTSSKSIDFTVSERTFGIFSRNATGTGLSVLQNYTSPDIQPANGPGESAIPGQIGILWGTGLGASLNAEDRNPPAPGNLTDLDEVKVYIGDREAEILYAGRSGCCSGVDQVNFVVPAGIEGCFVPVFVTVGGVPSNFTTMSIASTPGACEGAFGLAKQDVAELLEWETIRLGMVGLRRTKFQSPFLTINNDTGFADFVEFTGEGFQTAGDAIADAALPPGTCTATNFRHDALVKEGIPVAPARQNLFRLRPLNAGEVITITGPFGYRFLGLAPNSGGTYRGSLSNPSNPLQGYLFPGPYSIGNGLGGNDVGAFNFTKLMSSFDPWTNKASIETISRAQGLTITWEPGLNPTGVVSISAYSLSVPKKVASELVCYAETAPGSFTVPAHVLRSMVESDPGPLPIVTGNLTFGGISRPSRFEAPGLDIGVFTSSFLESKEVLFQ